VSNGSQRPHPLILYFPSILATVIAVGIGAYLLIDNLTEDNERVPTVPEFDARVEAKSEYSRMTNNTVTSAFCGAIRYRSSDDTWEIECRFDREEAREITYWEVTPDRVATLIETRSEPLN
jgi:hypothetical protein